MFTIFTPEEQLIGPGRWKVTARTGVDGPVDMCKRQCGMWGGWSELSAAFRSAPQCDIQTTADPRGPTDFRDCCSLGPSLGFSRPVVRTKSHSGALLG